MADPSIHIFNPYSARMQNSRGKLQEIITYGDSRFRAAMLAISKSKGDKVTWAQKRLLQELVSQLPFTSTYLMGPSVLYRIVHWVCNSRWACGQYPDHPPIPRRQYWAIVNLGLTGADRDQFFAGAGCGH